MYCHFVFWQRNGEGGVVNLFTLKSSTCQNVYKNKTRLALHLVDSMVKFVAEQYVYRLYYYTCIHYFSFRFESFNSNVQN